MFSYFNGKNSGEKGTMMMMWEEKGNCKIMYTQRIMNAYAASMASKPEYKCSRMLVHLCSLWNIILWVLSAAMPF